jgi:hypothetical protein
VIIVKASELQVGDILRGCRNPGGGEVTPWGGHIVRSVPEAATDRGWTGHLHFLMQFGSNLPKKEYKRPDMEFQIERSGVQMIKSAHVDEFPGQCPRCQRKAYVSALAVAHQNESAAQDCPARRC